MKLDKNTHLLQADKAKEQGSTGGILKYLYHLKPGFLRESLFSFLGYHYFYLYAFSLGHRQLSQFNKMKSTLKSFQSPLITSSICLAMSHFSTQHWVTLITQCQCYVQHKNRHTDPFITRLLSMSSRAPNKFLVTKEHSLHTILDSSQMWGLVWNSIPKSLSTSLLPLLSLMDKCLPSSCSTFQIISSLKHQSWCLNSR